MIKAVIIDLDDTLCLTEAVCFEMENEVLVKMGLKPMTRDVHLSTWGQPLFEVIASRSPGIDVEQFKQFYGPVIDTYTSSGRLDSISNENYKALDMLINSQKTLFVLTSRTHQELSHLLEPDHLLKKKVTAFYYRDNMQFHKPDPRAFKKLLTGNNLQPNECVYVGDSVSDAVAAKEAGLHFIACLESGIRIREDFAHLPVDGFIDRFSEIAHSVEVLSKQFENHTRE